MSMKKTLELAKSLNEGDKTPLPKWLWKVESMPAFDGVTLEPEYIQQFGLPFPKFDTGNQIEVAGATLTFPGKIDVSSVTMLIHEDNKVRALKYIFQWMSNIRNPVTGGYFLPSRYKKGINVVLHDNKGDPLAKASLRGVWPSAIQDWELVYNDDGFHQVSVQLEVDASYLEIL